MNYVASADEIERAKDLIFDAMDNSPVGMSVKQATCDMLHHFNAILDGYEIALHEIENREFYQAIGLQINERWGQN